MLVGCWSMARFEGRLWIKNAQTDETKNNPFNYKNNTYFTGMDVSNLT